jgi:hypothetical protein
LIVNTPFKHLDFSRLTTAGLPAPRLHKASAARSKQLPLSQNQPKPVRSASAFRERISPVLGSTEEFMG